MYDPGSTLQCNGIPTRSDAPRDIDDGSRSRASRHASRTSSGHAAYRTTSAIVVDRLNVPACSRCAASEWRRGWCFSCAYTPRYSRHVQCRACHASTGTNWNLLGPLRGRPTRREPAVPSPAVRFGFRLHTRCTPVAPRAAARTAESRAAATRRAGVRLGPRLRQIPPRS